jgi:hypothetical protein
MCVLLTGAPEGPKSVQGDEAERRNTAELAMESGAEHGVNI